jgi:hypothetical protein
MWMSIAHARRELLGRAGGEVAVAINLYFEQMSAAREDLKRRGLATEAEQPVRKKRSAEEERADREAVRRVEAGDDDE